MALNVKNVVKMEEEDDDMDVEALRMAALQTLKKSSMKSEPSSTPLISNGPTILARNNINRRGSHPPRGRGMRVLRGSLPRPRMKINPHPRAYPNPGNNYQNFHGGCNNTFFPSRPTNSNLITIVPTVPDTSESEQYVSKDLNHINIKQEPSSATISVTEQEKVPAKFRRVDDNSESEESDEESDKDTRSCSDAGESSGEDDNKDNVEKESDNESEKDADVVNLQPEDEGEDSLERLMKELEDEINETSDDKKRPQPVNTQKHDKRVKRERKEKKRKEKVPLKPTYVADVRADNSLPSKSDPTPGTSSPSPQPRSRSPRSPSPRHAQALKSASRSPQLSLSSGRPHSPKRAASPGGPWSPRKCTSPRRALSPQGVHALPRGTASSRALSPREPRSRSRSPTRSYPAASPSRRSRSRTRSPYRSPRRSPIRYPPRLSSPGRLAALRSRSRSPRRFRSKSRSPLRGGYLRRSRSPRSPSRGLRRSPSPLRRSRSRSPPGLYHPRHSRSISPRGSFKGRRSFSPKGRRSPSPYGKKMSPRRRSRSVSPWANAYPPLRSRSPPPYRSPVGRRYSPTPHRALSPARSYRSPSPGPGLGPGLGGRVPARRRSPLPPAHHRALSPSYRFTPPKSMRRSPSPGRVRDRLPSPGPGRLRDRPPSPVRMRVSPPRARDRLPSPGRVRDRLSPAGRARERALSPGRVRERPLSPGRIRERALSPGRARDRLPSPGRLRERVLSPGRVRDRLPSPGRQRERPPSPGRVRDRLSPVKSRDRLVSPGPGRARDRLPSPPMRGAQRPGSPRKFTKTHQGGRAPSPPSQSTQKSLSSPRLERARSNSESISLSPSPEPQTSHRLNEERSRRKNQPLHDGLADSKQCRSDLRSTLPKRRVVSIDDGKNGASLVEDQSKREKKKKSKKEKKSRKCGGSQEMDPVLEARRRKFESSAPVEVTGKKIRLRTNTAEPADFEKSEIHHNETLDIEKEKERELKEVTEIDDSILDRELMGGVDLLWSDEEEDEVPTAASESVHFKRTFNLDAGSSNTGKENVPEEGSKHNFAEPSSTTSSPHVNESNDGKESAPEDYEDSGDSESEHVRPEDSWPKTNKELKEYILSQAKKNVSTRLSSNTPERETVKSKAKGSDDRKKHDDLRAELSRRRAERNTKVNSTPDPDTLPRRLLQSALQGVGVKPSVSSGSRKRRRSPSADDKDKKDSERRRVLVLRRAMEQKAPAINIIIPKVDSPAESCSKSPGKVPIHMRLGVGSRGEDDSLNKVKLKRNVSVGRKKQV